MSGVRILVAGVAVLALAACGRPSLSADAAADLQARVELVQEAVAAGDHELAERRLVALEQVARRWERRGHAERSRVREIVLAAEAVAAQLPASTSPAGAAVPSAPSDTRVVEESWEDDGADDDHWEKSGPGRGKGRKLGHSKHDGGDD